MPAPVTHYLPLTAIRRARLLPSPGRVLVRTGQQVSAVDPVAETYLPESHVLLDVRRALGVPSAAKAESLVERKPGEKVQKGDVIAETGGMFSRVIRAPSNGTIVAVSNGQVTLETETPPFTLRAGMPGVVADILADRGVIIETSGALLQGVWGNGHCDQGVLLALARSPDDELTRDRLEVSMRGAVGAAGYIGQAGVITLAAELPLRGLILASMNPQLLAEAQAARIPIIVLEGFGRIPLNPAVYKLLTTSEKRDAAVNACAWDRYNGDRPEVVIPLPAEAEMAPDTDEFKPGQQVRIQGAPYTGQTAAVVQVKPGSSTLQNGLRAPAAEVRFENGEKVIIPLANLDVLE